MNTNQKYNDEAAKQSATFEFYPFADGLCVVSFSNPEGLTKIIVPEQVDNLKVVALRESCFESHKEITEVSLPETIGYIPDRCFFNCSRLTSVVSKGVKFIGKSAFEGCVNLTDVIIPDGAEVIQERTFCCCNNLTNMIIPNGVKTIKEYAFSGCAGLINVKLPDDLWSIEPHVFQGGDNLTDIVIPDSVKAIGKFAFSGCGNLTNITIRHKPPKF